jgi:hypothetical protein
LSKEKLERLKATVDLTDGHDMGNALSIYIYANVQDTPPKRIPHDRHATRDPATILRPIIRTNCVSSMDAAIVE